MINDFCPRCNALTTMTSNVTHSNEKDSEGKHFKIVSTSYYCNICHTFVKSDNNKLPLNTEEHK